MVLTCLHGFLGLPRDWDFLRGDFEIATPPLDAIPTRGDVLVGYSLGGRLALHALLAGATYQRAVIVSARVTAPDAKRRERDDEWARRFESDDWPPLMRDWNTQPIFGGRAIAREERDFDRAALARALREWSPAAMPPLIGRLHEIEIPVLWIAGAEDVIYVDEGRRAVEKLPRAALNVVDGAAHRVPWERPREFAALLKRFVGGDSVRADG